jgi:hypothetical protein
MWVSLTMEEHEKWDSYFRMVSANKNSQSACSRIYHMSGTSINVVRD